MKPKNCWEVMKCGRQPDGENAKDCGVCPAALPGQYDGINRGEHAGRFCWIVTGTFCSGEDQGSYSQKIVHCLSCVFLEQVNDEEGRNFILTPTEAQQELNKDKVQ